MAVFLVVKCVMVALNDGMVSANAYGDERISIFFIKLVENASYIVFSSNFGKIAYSEKDNMKSRRNAV